MLQLYNFTKQKTNVSFNNVNDDGQILGNNYFPNKVDDTH